MKYNLFIVIIIVILMCILLTLDCEELYDEKKENFIGYGYGYKTPYYVNGLPYPYYYSGCNETMFGNVACGNPPFFY